ncbi:MAG: hypothetical protein M3Q03_05570 [Chloroflexota bacterium]|nr:hypothetical protein [Chloroflexota bacterium]
MDEARMKRTAQGLIGGAAILLGVIGGVTGSAATVAVAPNAPEPYDGSGCGAGTAELRYAKSDLPVEQDRSGNANYGVGPTAEVA